MRHFKRFLLCLACLLTVCGAAFALTYEEAYNQASPLGGTENYKVFTHPASIDGVDAGLMTGLAADVFYENGELTILVDAEQTRWDTVVANGYFTGSGEVSIDPGILSPTGESMEYRHSGFSLNYPENMIVEYLRRDAEQADYNAAAYARNGVAIGRYDEESSLFQPTEVEDRGLMCVWNTGNGLKFEYIVIDIRYTSTNAVKVNIPKVPAEDIVLLADMPQSDRELFITSVENGNVLLSVEQVSSLSQVHGTVYVMTPQEAGDEAWTCHVGSWDAPMFDAGQFGLERRAAQIYSADFSRENSTSENNWQLEWRDENGIVQSYASLYIAVVTGDPQPWPYYVPEWKPVDPARMTLYTYDLPSGVGAEYDGNGLLSLTIDHDRLPQSADYGSASYRILVAPPEQGCTLRGWTQSSANDIFGVENAEWNKPSELMRTRDRAQTYQEDDHVISTNLFTTYHQDGSDLTVYMTSEMTGQFAGRTILISWWKEGDDPQTADPVLTEYIVVRQESCVHVLTSTPYENEDELPQVVTQPVIIIPQGSINNPKNSMEFVAQIYPQKGENSRYYKLELLDENGDIVKLDKGQYKVFLPFPEGLTDEQKQGLELYHLTDAHVEVENFTINGGNLHITDAGIWFQAKSFSPFVLKWPGGNSSEGGNHTPVYECPNGHPLQYDGAFEGKGFAEFCAGGPSCHEALIELNITDKAYDGDPVEPVFNCLGDQWLGELPHMVYAEILPDGAWSDWTTDAPSSIGNHVARLVFGMLETDDFFFSITEASGGYTEVHTSYPFTDADVSPELAAAGYHTTALIENRLKAEMMEMGVLPENTLLYNAKLMYRLPTGEWVEADESHFPEDGALYVKIPLPTGMNPYLYGFSVLHMLSNGETERPESISILLENGVYHLGFTVNGLSPIMIGWMEKPPATIPQTGDSATPLMWLALCAGSMACAALLMHKRRRV